MKGVVVCVFLLLAVLQCVHVTLAGTLVSVKDPNWYFTEYNWLKPSDGSYARSANPGAYFKVGFTGTSCDLVVGASSVTTPFMNIRYTIDGQPYKQVLLPTNLTITLATGLAAGNHFLTLYILNSLQSLDRWITPVCALTVTGLMLDSGAKTLPPVLKPKRMMVFWDSIGEGVLSISRTSGGDLVDNDSTVTSLISAAAGLSAEVSVVAFGRQGYTIYGNGNVAPLFTPKNDTISAWDKFDATHSRLDPNGHLTPNPDYIFCGHGTNDMNAPGNSVMASVIGWLEAQRNASPSSWIFLVIPYGGYQRSAITQGFNTYKTAHTTDTSCVLIDLGSDAAQGVAGQGPSEFSYDGLHPTAIRDGQLGSMLAVAAARYLQQKGNKLNVI